MNWKINGNEIVFDNNRNVKFDFPVKEARIIGATIVVILDVPSKISMPENVFGVSLEGKIIWTIERRPGLSNPNFRYEGFSGSQPEKRGIVLLYNISSTMVTVNLDTGRILHTELWK